MQQTKLDLDQMLYDAGVYHPDSSDFIQQEKSLTRFMEKACTQYLENPITMESTGVSTSHGPISEQTDDLMETHFDERMDLFTGFLDSKYRAYTMAYYGENGDADITLEQAEYEKFRLIAKRAQIRGDENILNIGCGFGPLETFLLEEYPEITVTGITPSKIQIQYMRQQMQDSQHPLHDRFTLIEGVFDESITDTLGDTRFDLIMSVGFMEHALNMRKILEIIAGLLKPGGRMFHHFITSRVPTPQVHLGEKTVIGKYFPGGRVWPQQELCRHTDHFELVDTWFLNGKNYWRTLDDWQRNYWKSIPALYDNGFSIEAIRFWNDYFLLCKVMFAPLDGTFYGNSHYLFKLK